MSLKTSGRLCLLPYSLLTSLSSLWGLEFSLKNFLVCCLATTIPGSGWRKVGGSEWGVGNWGNPHYALCRFSHIPPLVICGPVPRSPMSFVPESGGFVVEFSRSISHHFLEELRRESFVLFCSE